jgi:hypothetical protein
VGDGLGLSGILRSNSEISILQFFHETTGWRNDQTRGPAIEAVGELMFDAYKLVSFASHMVAQDLFFLKSRSFAETIVLRFTWSVYVGPFIAQQLALFGIRSDEKR